MTDPAAPPDPAPPPTRGLRESLAVYLRPESLRMLALGFAAGLPLLLTAGTLALRLREAGIDIDTIGFLGWVGLAYSFKWAWAPLVDRLPLPILTRVLGRRRSWLLLAQAAVAAGLLGMAWTDPARNLPALVGWALLVAFASATQDIALDAFRIESAPAREQPALAASYQMGYRLATIWAGAGALWLAAWAEIPAAGLHGYQNTAWRAAYIVMAASMAVGALTVLFSPEPAPAAIAPARNARQWLEQALVAPFAEFFHRHRWHAALVLALIGLYRISDVVMGGMAGPFYVDMGFDKEEIAAVSKMFGVAMTLAGTFIGGALAMRLGVMRVLLGGAFASAASNLLFAWLATRGHDLPAFVAVVCADNLAGGIASAAFVGYLSGLTSVRYSATQYALFSSIAQLLPKFIAGYAGVYVKAFGYPSFFIGTALLGLPVVLLVWVAQRKR
ncbi:MAG: MFS transporter [Burkholderiaceae bacterium]|jgi:PAT family beta-lactamase induction signal transducer AmpG|nr:MFS transporter [Burkholderiaceae bacterium]